MLCTQYILLLLPTSPISNHGITLKNYLLKYYSAEDKDGRTKLRIFLTSNQRQIPGWLGSFQAETGNTGFFKSPSEWRVWRELSPRRFLSSYSVPLSPPGRKCLFAMIGMGGEWIYVFSWCWDSNEIFPGLVTSPSLSPEQNPSTGTASFFLPPWLF